MPKSPDAFRTISEVADWLGIQAHVLRFWESKFTQVKPIKRAGGRRYYRPNDMLLLGGIKKLLHDDGLTIKGVQKILREEGMSYVAEMSVSLDELTLSQMETVPSRAEVPAAPMMEDAEPETGVILPFGVTPEPEIKTETEAAETKGIKAKSEVDSPPPAADAGPVDAYAATAIDLQAEPIGETPEAAPEPNPETLSSAPEEPTAEPTPSSTEPEAPQAAATEYALTPKPQEAQSDAEPIVQPEPLPVAATEATEEHDADDAAADIPDRVEETAAQEIHTDGSMSPLPEFVHSPVAEEPPSEDTVSPAEETVTADATETAGKIDLAPEPEHEPEPAPEPSPPRPIDIGMPEITPESDIHAEPGALAATARIRSLTPARVEQIRPLLKQLTALRDSMMTQRRAPTKD